MATNEFDEIGFSKEVERNEKIRSLEERLKQRQSYVDKQHQERLQSVIQEAIFDLCAGGVDEDTAKIVIHLITQRKVRNVSLFH